MTKILLVEDDPILGKGVQVNCQVAGYEVDWVQNLAQARDKNTSAELALILLDINLPDGSGLLFCQEIRSKGSRIPIIMLTAKTDEDSVVAGLTYGANDYVKKPFSTKELIARIKTALREPLLRENQNRFGPIIVLNEQRRILVEGKELELNRREFDIFSHLVRHAEAVVTREAILQVLDPQGEVVDRTVDSHLSHIRAKLRKQEIMNVIISSVYGMGYRLEVH